MVKLHFFVDISRSKQSSANYIGDGPTLRNSTGEFNNSISYQAPDSISRLTRSEVNRNNKNASQQQLKSIQDNAKIKNGLIIYKNRTNLPFKVKELDSNITESRIGINHVCVGNIVTKINGIELNEYDNKTVAELLNSIILTSIEHYSPNQWRQHQRI